MLGTQDHCGCGQGPAGYIWRFSSGPCGVGDQIRGLITLSCLVSFFYFFLVLLFFLPFFNFYVTPGGIQRLYKILRVELEEARCKANN